MANGDCENGEHAQCACAQPAKPGGIEDDQPCSQQLARDGRDREETGGGQIHIHHFLHDDLEIEEAENARHPEKGSEHQLGGDQENGMREQRDDEVFHVSSGWN